ITELLAKVGLDGATIARVHAIAGIRSLPDLLEAMGENAPMAEPFRDTIAALEAMGLGEFLDLDLTIVRGLAYYTGTVFELFDAGRTLRAICGGGRYDDLTSAVGGVQLAAVGFGMGDVVLGELLKEKGLLPEYAGSIDVFVAAEGEGMEGALLLTHRLREAGIRAEYALGGQTLSKQQDIAKARNARLLVTLGATEAQVRDLRTRTQASHSATQLMAAIKMALAE
ncbi:MAG TPA: ATP phosphoribosyltransferase regulatory subunit, partial [Gemmatimonadales bacterium]|nr:ATP phosphoribosyltransferase regulatory subunit [Gemmatimonadales bacterium]